MKCPTVNCRPCSRSILNRLKVGTPDYAKISEDIKAFNAGVARQVDDGRSKGASAVDAVGADLDGHLGDASPGAKAADPLKELLELSVNEILPSTQTGDENLLDLGFSTPLVFDQHSHPRVDPSDLNLTSQPAAPLRDPNDPFDFDVTPKMETRKPEPPKQTPPPANDDPFSFL